MTISKCSSTVTTVHLSGIKTLVITSMNLTVIMLTLHKKAIAINKLYNKELKVIDTVIAALHLLMIV